MVPLIYVKNQFEIIRALSFKEVLKDLVSTALMHLLLTFSSLITNEYIPSDVIVVSAGV